MKIFLLVYFFKIKINIEIYNRKSIKRKTHLHVHSIGLLRVNHQQFYSFVSTHFHLYTSNSLVWFDVFQEGHLNRDGQLTMFLEQFVCFFFLVFFFCFDRVEVKRVSRWSVFIIRQVSSRCRLSEARIEYLVINVGYQKSWQRI